MFLKIATINTNKSSIHKIPLLADFMQLQSFQLASLQEVDVNAESAGGFCKSWWARGYTALLAPLDAVRKLHRVALVSALPIKQVSLGDGFDASRVAAGLVELQCQGRSQAILCIAVYGYPSDLSRTSTLVSDIMQRAAVFGGPVVALGDWNTTEEESALFSVIAAGQMIPLDDGDRSDLQPTNPTRTRRIDFGLSTSHIRATEVRHHDRDDLSDHLCVAYTLDLEARRQCATLPCFPRLEQTDLKSINETFVANWREENFQVHLENKDVDQALNVLCRTAETCLSMPGPASPSDISRADEWIPAKRNTSQPHVTADGHASPSLCILRKLVAQLRQLKAQPFDEHLRKAVRRRCGDLRRRLPHTPFLNLDDLEESIRAADGLQQSLADQEKKAHIERWKQVTRQDDNTATAWVRNWADRRILLDTPPCELEKAPTDIHPASIIRAQTSVWMSKWTCHSNDTAEQALHEILQTVPRPQQGFVETQISGDELYAAVKKIARKAAGPDRWSGELLHLPPHWWTALGQLWSWVLQCGTVPLLWRRATIVLVPKKHTEYRPIALTSILWRAGARILCQRLQPWILSWCSPYAVGGAPGKGTFDAHAILLASWHQGARAYVQQDLSAYFDSIQLPALMTFLRHMRAPACLQAVLSSFYTRAQRLFKVARLTGDQWHTPSRGLLQGCPLSPVCALLIGNIWHNYVTQGAVRALIYVDDRIMWANPRDPRTVEALADGINRSNRFDAILNFTCRPSKCAIVHPSDDQQLCAFANRIQYPARPTWKCKREARGF